ncbi:MAG: ABC transporter ATP-binding protein [Mogibacterium sp.]|nr:ABC transporter ATP-binding protein [Mogibacterium sp.]MBQ6501745.1 ABC transporter ATP-binding protein [Mogibacterium sp.]
MIRLKNVSKYYYSKGIIASGISRVNLDLDAGEFVVITGESGSGKSTLLNVISGLDTYEEGEMYIEGKETSHYTASDFESYRQQYISCIFQSFNLVSSYTVYQNVALAMQIDGCDPSEIRLTVNDIIKKVGLYEFRNRKVSKLSGGQKQRVAIARALAKDTKILVADEPTGNLDSESAEGIVELLTDIASDKLVIVVTHNYEQFRDHATRIIKMHDGKIVEDTGAASGKIKDEAAPAYGHRSTRAEHRAKKESISYGTQLKLGVRNTFNLPAKFLLLLLVFIFVISSVSAQYVSVKKQKDTVAEVGWNNYFTNYDPKRIVVEKQDRSAFTKADYEALENAPHVEKLIREDIMYDSSVYIENKDFSFYGYVLNINNLDKTPDLGGLPKADDEVVLSGYDDGWTFGEKPGELIGKTFTVSTDGGAEQKVKVAGIVMLGTDGDEEEMVTENNMIYFSDPLIAEVRKSMYASNSTTTMLINGTEQTLYPGSGGLTVNENVPEGYILLPTSYDPMFKEGYAAGKEVELRAKALYYDQELSLMIMGTYGEKTFERKTGLENLAEHDGEIYINEMDFRRLYEKGSFQASVFVDDTKNTDGMKDMLERGGYHTLVLKDHINNFMNEELVSIIQLPMAVIVCLAVFFIAYFVIRLILKSRGVYFATLRMLGMGKEPARRIMRVELILDCMISYALFMLFIYLNRIGVVNSAKLMDHLTYLTVRDYIVLAVILLVMAVLISGRFMRSIFKSSAMGTYREEA